MEKLSELKNRVIDYLSGLSAFEDAEVTAAYPAGARTLPIQRPVIAVETAGVELESAGLGGYLGGDAPSYGAAALVTLRFYICHGAALGCGTLYESLCDALMDAGWLSARRISCGRAEWDAKIGSYALTATAEFKTAWIVPVMEERRFSDFYLKDVTI